MTTTNPSTTDPPLPLEQRAIFIWHTLRSFTTLVIITLILSGVTLLGLLIPQQPESITGLSTEALWIATLPDWLQPLGGVLYQLGLAQIFQSLWFWLPVGGLLLHSLIALADYAPASWRRSRQTMPALEWQHPLARRIEQSVRLSDAPDEFLTERQQTLTTAGFVVYQPSAEAEERIIGATRRRWSWLGVVLFYSGIILLIGAFLVSHFFLERDRLTLTSAESQPSGLLDGRLRLDEVDTGRWTAQVTYTPADAEQAPQSLTWRRYWPSILNGSLIWPTTLNPNLTIQLLDEEDNRLQLTSPQAEDSTAEALNIALDELDTPIYFSVPDITLAFQLSSLGDNRYNVRVLQGEAGDLIENLEVEAQQTIIIEGLSLILTETYDLQIVAGRDPALPIYLLGALLIIGGGIATFLLPPTQVWLIPDIKGRGGQLYGVMEQPFGAEETMASFLRAVLGEEAETEEEE